MAAIDSSARHLARLVLSEVIGVRVRLAMNKESALAGLILQEYQLIANWDR